MQKFIRNLALQASPSIFAWIKRKRAVHESFSQFGEDVILWNLLKQKKEGFYVDCGAFDPYIHSNNAKFSR